MSTTPGVGQGATIDRGSLLFFRLLDVAEELDLDRAQERGEVRRVALRQETSAALALEALPAELSLGERTVVLAKGTTVRASVRVRLYRFGAISVLFEVPIEPGATLGSLVPLAAAGWESRELDDVARAIAKELDRTLSAFAVGGHYDSPVVERYGIVLARELRGDALDDPDVLARLLLGEDDPRPLAASERDDVLRDRFRYFADDLAIVHTSSALVVEPGAGNDVALALELAISQLLELRTYDELIDRELDRVYQELERTSTGAWWLFGHGHRALSRRVQQQMLELAELADRAESAVKVATDAFLGRIYLAALGRMRAVAWRESVSRKLALFARVYDVLREEAHAQRALVVELVVVLLIAFEVVMALWAE